MRTGGSDSLNPAFVVVVPGVLLLVLLAVIVWYQRYV